MIAYARSCFAFKSLIKIIGKITPNTLSVKCCPNKEKWISIKSSVNKVIENNFEDHHNCDLKNSLHLEIQNLKDQSRDIIEEQELRENIEEAKKRRGIIDNLLFTTHFSDFKKIYKLLKLKMKDRKKIKKLYLQIKEKQKQIDSINKDILKKKSFLHSIKDIEIFIKIAEYMSDKVNNIEKSSFDKYQRNINAYKTILSSFYKKNYSNIDNLEKKLGIFLRLSILE